jgi:citrate lyase subunit beta / citryl-CoA lyase
MSSTISDQSDRLSKLAVSSRSQVLERNARRRADLPLRYLGQQSHLTAPASNPPLAMKAASDAFGVARRGLDRYGITAADIARRLELDEGLVDDVVQTEGTAPVVMLDLEDGVPPQLADDARREAGELFRNPGWAPALRFYRPSSVNAERSVADLVDVLLAAGDGVAPEDYPVDGIIFPKVQHGHEVEWLCELLDAVEEELSLPANRIRVSYLIESGWALQNLGELAIAGRDRLAGMVLGTVDLSADVGVPEVRFHHPLFEWARAEIVTACGGAGVPAIDGMTVNFPVGLAQLSEAENKERVLERIEANYRDTLHSIDLGMAGRWAGHPLQMLSILLAFRSAFTAESVEDNLQRVEEFAAAMDEGKGAVAEGMSGDLLDIGTDLQVRMLLRRATAWGLLDPQRAIAAGIATADEMETAP